MKKLFIPIAILTSCLLFSCATTGQVSENPGDSQDLVSSGSVVKENDNSAKTEEDKKIAEAKKAEEEKNAAEAKKAEEEKKAAEAKKAEEEKKAAEAKKAEEEKKAENSKKTKDEMKALGYSDAGSLDGACRVAKFKMEAPKTFAVYKPSKYRAIPETRVDIVYTNTKNTEEEFTLRKNVGNLDVSEDSRNYSQVTFLNYGGIRMLAKGTEPDLYKVVTWSSGDYSYSFVSNVGFPQEVIFALIRDIE